MGDRRSKSRLKTPTVSQNKTPQPPPIPVLPPLPPPNELNVPLPPLPPDLIKLVTQKGPRPPPPETQTPASPTPSESEVEEIYEEQPATDWESRAKHAEERARRSDLELALLKSAAQRYDPTEAAGFSKRSGFTEGDVRHMVRAAVVAAGQHTGGRPEVNIFFQSGSITNNTIAPEAQGPYQGQRRFHWSHTQQQHNPQGTPYEQPAVEAPQVSAPARQGNQSKSHGRQRGNRGGDRRGNPYQRGPAARPNQSQNYYPEEELPPQGGWR
jgi:hypothetical protein